MEILLDPTIWAGLATLVVLEIVLGIDNLIFIAILSDKLPPHERQKARVVGLSLALGMRMVLLFSISWMTTLTAPIFTVLGNEISGRDLIMFVGGGFLLFKATMELHEKLEGHHYKKTGPIHYASFGSVILQIVVLDAVFSLDAVITAVGMTPHLPVMMIAVCIAMGIMILASNRLMNFVSAHPTVVILCLGFLLMIGFSLIVEGLNYHIPKGYLYAAIGFSVVIEAFNQMAQNNRRRNYERIDPRTRVSQAVLGLLGIKSNDTSIQPELSALATKNNELTAFKPQERLMVQRVLQLSEQQVRGIMTPRNDLHWIDLEDSTEKLEKDILECPYSCLVVARNRTIDEPAGVVLKKDLADMLLREKNTKNISSLVKEPIAIPDVMTALQTLDNFRRSRIHVGFVVDEFGSLQGLVTLTDIVEAIAGDMPEHHDDESDRFTYDKKADGSIVMSGDLTIMELNEIIGEVELPEGDYTIIAGIALNALKRVPKKGDKFLLGTWEVTIEEMDKRRVNKLRFVNKAANEEEAA